MEAIPIRPYQPHDRDGVVRTVRLVFEEYGFAWEGEGYCADLYDVETYYPRENGGFWVAERDGEVVGCVGLVLHDRLNGELGETQVFHGVPRVCATDAELVRLYVRPDARGHRLGVRLTQTVMDEAKARGCSMIELWSDKHLLHAHRMYERMGAVRVGERICPGDPDQSPEWGFYLPL